MFTKIRKLFGRPSCKSEGKSNKKSQEEPLLIWGMTDGPLLIWGMTEGPYFQDEVPEEFPEGSKVMAVAKMSHQDRVFLEEIYFTSLDDYYLFHKHFLGTVDPLIFPNGIEGVNIPETNSKEARPI